MIGTSCDSRYKQIEKLSKMAAISIRKNDCSEDLKRVSDCARKLMSVNECVTQQAVESSFGRSVGQQREPRNTRVDKRDSWAACESLGSNFGPSLGLPQPRVPGISANDLDESCSYWMGL